MSPNSPQDLTQLLHRWNEGSASALEELAQAVQHELRKLARHYLRGEKVGHLLESAALVNEAWLRLFDWKQISWQNRAQFFGVAAQMMRHVLVDEARRRLQVKRGGEVFQVSLSGVTEGKVWDATELIALSQALDKLAEFDERKCRVIEWHYFAGLSQQEIAEVLQVTVRTVQRETRLAQAWLYRALKSQLDSESSQGTSADES